MEREAFIQHASGWLPNNARLAVEVYRGAVRAEGEKAAQAFETLFADHDWPPRWRDTIFDYHHYHSTTHEALGVYAGFARLALGGPGGRIIEVQAGDALLLPVGTGHCRIDGSDDFAVVGAYPAGCEWDICTEAATSETFERMRRVPIPKRNPLTGTGAIFGQ